MCFFGGRSGSRWWIRPSSTGFKTCQNGPCLDAWWLLLCQISATTSVTTYAVRFYIWRWNQVPTGLYHTFETRLEVCRGHRTGDLGKQIWVRLKARPNSQCVCFHYFCSESLLRIHWADRVVYIRPNHFVKTWHMFSSHQGIAILSCLARYKSNMDLPEKIGTPYCQRYSSSKYIKMTILGDEILSCLRTPCVSSYLKSLYRIAPEAGLCMVGRHLSRLLGCRILELDMKSCNLPLGRDGTLVYFGILFIHFLLVFLGIKSDTNCHL